MMSFFTLKRLVAVALGALLMAGCQAEPGAKKIPKPDELQKVDKKLNDVSFNPAVDILFIIDDSGSMDTYQRKLAENSKLFIDQFFKSKFINFHIGVTTASVDIPDSVAGDGKLHLVDGYTYVDRTTADKEIVLAKMLNVGISGLWQEEFFSIHQLALSPGMLQGFNQGFYRDAAQLAIFVLTDTEDQSQFSAQSSYDFLLDLKDQDDTKLHYVAAIIDDGASCTGEAERPRKIKQMIELHDTRGYQMDLCKNDYGSDMAQVAANLVRAVSTIYLEELPDVRTLKVTYGDIVIPNDRDKGWVYDADLNAIYLSPNIEILDPKPQELSITFESVYK
ncbi:MAG: hypothetical protein AAF203_04600 [Pseudomonadota bacterium]